MWLIDTLQRVKANVAKTMYIIQDGAVQHPLELEGLLIWLVVGSLSKNVISYGLSLFLSFLSFLNDTQFVNLFE